MHPISDGVPPLSPMGSSPGAMTEVHSPNPLIKIHVMESDMRASSMQGVMWQQKEKEKHDEEIRRTTEAKDAVFFLDKPRFQVATLTVVILNAVTIGLETDLASLSERQRDLIALFNQCFLLFYLAEFAVRILFKGLQAFHDKFMIVDFVVITLCMLERALAANSAFVRSLPVFRLWRFIKVARTLGLARFSPTLMLLSKGIPPICMSMFWLGLVGCGMLFGFGAFVKTVLGDSGEWSDKQDPSVYWGPFDAFDNRMYFGTWMRSFFTMSQVMTRSDSADRIVRPTLEVYPLLLLFYIMFFILSYGLLVSVVSTVVIEAAKNTKAIEKADAQLRQLEREQISKQCIEIVQLVDQNNDGELSRVELEVALEDESFRELLEALQVPLLDSESMVQMLDRNGDGIITYDELRRSVMDMENPLGSNDWTWIQLWVDSIAMGSQRFDRRLEELKREIVEINVKIASAIDSIEHWRELRKIPTLYLAALEKVRSALPEMPPEPTRIVKKAKTLPVNDQAKVLEFFRNCFSFSPAHSVSAAAPPPLPLLPNVVPPEIHEMASPPREPPQQVRSLLSAADAAAVALTPPPPRRHRHTSLPEAPPAYREEAIVERKRMADLADQDTVRLLHPLRATAALKNTVSQLRAASAHPLGPARLDGPAAQWLT